MAYIETNEKIHIMNTTKIDRIFDEIRYELGFDSVPQLFEDMAMNPHLLENNWQIFRSTVLKGHLPRALKELIGIAICQLYGREYTLKPNLQRLSSLRIFQGIQEPLMKNFDDSSLLAIEKVVIHFAIQAATEPQSLTCDDYHRLEDFGLTSDEIFEIITTANLFVFINQYIDEILSESDQL